MEEKDKAAPRGRSAAQSRRGQSWEAGGGVSWADPATKSQVRAEGLAKSPMQRPFCVDVSRPVLQRLWDFQRDEQLGEDVNKVGAGHGQICVPVGAGEVGG